MFVTNYTSQIQLCRNNITQLKVKVTSEVILRILYISTVIVIVIGIFEQTVLHHYIGRNEIFNFLRTTCNTQVVLLHQSKILQTFIRPVYIRIKKFITSISESIYLFLRIFRIHTVINQSLIGEDCHIVRVHHVRHSCRRL